MWEGESIISLDLISLKNQLNDMFMYYIVIRTINEIYSSSKERKYITELIDTVPISKATINKECSNEEIVSRILKAVTFNTNSSPSILDLVINKGSFYYGNRKYTISKMNPSPNLIWNDEKYIIC